MRAGNEASGHGGRKMEGMELEDRWGYNGERSNICGLRSGSRG